MARKLITTGSPFEAKAGYSRAVLDGDTCFVSGTTGYDYEAMELPEDITAQTRNILKTIEWALGEAGMELADVVKVQVVVTDRQYVPAVMEILGEVFADIRPANYLFIADLVQPAMKVEIDATAKKRS